MVQLSFKKVTPRMGQNANLEFIKSREKYTEQFEKSVNQLDE